MCKELLKKKISVSVLVMVIGLCLAAPVLATSQMVAHWPMDEGSGTVVTDVVGGNHGTMVGLDPTAAWIEDGKLGGALRFDNINGHHIVVPHSAALDFGDEDFSISMWIRYPPGVDPTDQADIDRWIIKGTHVAPGTGSRYEVFIDDDGDVRFAIDNGPANVKSRIQVVPEPFITGDWVNVVAVRDTVNDQLSIYANGVQPDLFPDGDTGVDASGDISSGEDLWIGESTDETGTVMMGDIDDVRIFAQALTEDDIIFMYGPLPANGATDVVRDVVLRWPPSESASAYDVYLGTDVNDVNDASIDDPRDVLVSLSQAETTYQPDTLLDYGVTYYWRVDEVNEAEPNSPLKGDVWSFTVLNYIVVEDFEDYNDYEPDTVWNTWADGYDDPTNGSSAGYPDPDFFAVKEEHYLEYEIVHSGNWSMPLFYDNSSAMLSWVTRTLNADWTQEGVVTLTMWYHGVPDNAAEPMYVALDGNAVVTNDDANAALVTEWTRWDIPLQSFTGQGVNITNVGTLSIGFGNKDNPVAGGAGHVFFDDIRLYRPAQ